MGICKSGIAKQADKHGEAQFFALGRTTSNPAGLRPEIEALDLEMK
jgi:hypothetical protein